MRINLSLSHRSPLIWFLGGIVLIFLVGAFLVFRSRGTSITNVVSRSARVLSWLRTPDANPQWAVKAGQRCGNAPFIMPTDGFIGYLWGDSFRIGHRHQGIDVFSGKEVNVAPVLAVFPGYLTRLPDWVSTVIIRIPDDPLYPGRQIWTYYTHMASPSGESYIDPAFPAGSAEVFVQAGTLLGYQGSYSGSPGNPVGVHLHFSIVLDDGGGNFSNELEIENTLDPSPYLGLPLNARVNTGDIPVCSD